MAGGTPMTEADLKRAIVRQLLLEGGWGRRIEDKFAIGTLDMLLMTERNVIYAEAKLLKGMVSLPASVAQREAIQRFNNVGNPRARALVIGYRDGHIGFGLPGTRWDAKYICVWPRPSDGFTLTECLDEAVRLCFTPLSKETA